jgi:hypothetical protein
MGSDRNIARWDRLVEYYHQLERESDRIRVVDLGPSTEGNPFLLVVISSAQNLRELEAIRAANLKIADPRGLAEDEVDRLVASGKAVVCQTMSLHANEIGGTQMAPELAYDLLSRSEDEALRILDNVVFLLIPCANPDGQIMVADWYRQQIGTEYEGCDIPWLFHSYAGYENNRDAFQQNTAESQALGAILFREWKPHAYVDHHHYGAWGPRFYVPPYCEPIHPFAHPLVWREHSWYGAHMAYKLEEAGIAGVESGTVFPGWCHMGFHMIANYHNIAGMLTESADARLASPLYVHHGQLRGDDRGTMPSYDSQTRFPNPWTGGWWSLRDIVEQQKVAAWAVLDLAARHRETVLRSAIRKAIRQTELGTHGQTRAYTIPAEQHDPLTAAKLVQKLLLQGLEIEVAGAAFDAGGARYPAGSYRIPLSQPKGGLVRTLLARTLYPDNSWTRSRDGMLLTPYDTATDTMAEFMGVRIDPMGEVTGGEFSVIDSVPIPAVSKTRSRPAPLGFALDCRLNDSYLATNRMLAAGQRGWRAPAGLQAGGATLTPGAFVFEDGPDDLRDALEREIHVSFLPIESAAYERHELTRRRVGVYQGYWHGNTDEGWSRLLLEQFGFQYSTVRDADILRGNLCERYETIILPSSPSRLLTGDVDDEWWLKEMPMWEITHFPPEYRSGFGEKGRDLLRGFIQRGGTLIALGKSCQFAIESFELGLRDAAAGLSRKEFFCPGSTLHCRFDPGHPAAFGMPEDALVLFWGGMAFQVLPSPHSEGIEVVAAYPEHDILQSGLLIGEEVLRRKAAMVVARFGDGRVVLIGFRAQHRCQTHGTYKVLFNTMLN